MRVGGKWALFALAALVVLCVLGAGRYRWPLEPTRVAGHLNSATAPVGGLHWGRPGRASLTLLPWPVLRIIDAELLDARDRSVLDAPNAEIGLSPWELLRGEFAPVSARLLNPTALIDLDAARDGAEQMVAKPTSLSIRVEVEGGVAKVVSADLGLDTLIENVDGWFEWTKVRRPLGFSLSGVWRGEPVALEGSIASPLQLCEGLPSRAVVKITARPAELAFAGTWTPGNKSVFEGDLTTRIRSLSAVEGWLGLSASAPPIAAQEIGLQGKAAGSFDAIAVSEARLDVGGQGFEGSLNFSRLAGKTSVSGTLAADTLDMSALWSLAGPVLDSSGQWSRQPLIAAPSPTLDLDLRVSASHASWRGHRIEAAAASVLQKDRRLTVRLLDATDCQGQLSGEFSIEGAPDGLQLQASASLVNGDIGAELTEWGVTAYTGRGGYEGSFRAVGASPAELAASLSGSATFELQGGTIDGVNFEQALRRSLRRPVEFRDMAIGRTSFSSARAQLEITGGQARIVEARMEGPGAIVRMQGVIDIAARELRARIEAMQASAVGEPSVDAARLTIALYGPWSAPTISTSANTN